MQLALLPFFAVTVIVVVPEETVVTLPFSSTTATFSSLDFQVKVLSVAFQGVIVASSLNCSPATTVLVVSDNSTASTSTTSTSFSVTITFAEQLISLSLIVLKVKVTLASPALTPVMIPSSTFTTAGLDDVHFTESLTM